MHAVSGNVRTLACPFAGSAQGRNCSTQNGQVKFSLDRVMEFVQREIAPEIAADAMNQR